MHGFATAVAKKATGKRQMKLFMALVSKLSEFTSQLRTSLSFILEEVITFVTKRISLFDLLTLKYPASL